MTRALVLAIVASLALAPRARAQREIAVRADNDAFNFWQMPWARPDEEYTSGVRLTVSLDGPARWARRLGWALGTCAASTRPPCATHRYALGQNIYTAVRPKGYARALPGGRPDAGVLWVSATSQVERADAVNELSLTVGVTGKASLAEPMQRLFHDVAPRLNRPITWGPQVPAEPVFAVAFNRSRTFGAGSIALHPHGGASLGTLLTEARLGVGASYPNHRALTWLLPKKAGPLSLELAADAQLRAVARNAVLSGAFFRDGPHVALRPLVGEASAALRLQWRTLEAEWSAHRTGAEYVGRRRAHEWSTLSLAWRPAR